jgi:hypothetical protein
MTLLIDREKSDFICPFCGGAMEKVTRPVNHQLFSCIDCGADFGEGYLHGWHDAIKKCFTVLDLDARDDEYQKWLAAIIDKRRGESIE